LAKNISDVLKERIAKEGVARQTAKSRKWFLDSARKLGSVRRPRLLADRTQNLTDKPLIGDMLLYEYDPKLKDTLPYYDRLPLIFVVDYYKDGFLGINLHYLPPILRLQLFEVLIKLKNNKKYDHTTRLKLSWAVLKKVSKANFVQPTVKRYLTNHLRTRFLVIPPEEWEIVVFLPIEKFEKASRSQVWADSKRKMK